MARSTTRGNDPSHTPRLAALVAVAALLAFPTLATPTANATPEVVSLQVSGTIVALLEDGPADTPTTATTTADAPAAGLALVTPDGSTLPLAAGPATADLASGQQADVTVAVPAPLAAAAGVAVADVGSGPVDASTGAGAALVDVLDAQAPTVAVESATVTLDAALNPSPSATSHVVDVVMMSRSGGQFISTPALTTFLTSVSDYWRQVSRGLVADMTLGQVTSLASTAFCGGGVAAAASAAQAVTGRNDYLSSQGRHLLVLTPQADTASGTCPLPYLGQASVGYSGFASGGILHVYVDSSQAPDPALAAHEFGHNLGFYHAAGQFCSAGAWDGPYSRSLSPCGWSDYGDQFNLLGSPALAWPVNGPRADINAQQKDQNGVIAEGAGLRTADLTATASYTLVDTATTNRTAPQALKITDNGNRLYYVEYDRARGGVVVLRAPQYGDPSTQELLNSVRSIALRSDNSLGAPVTDGTMRYSGRQFFTTGQSRTLETGQVTITVVSATATVATVRVDRVVATTPPPNPPSTSALPNPAPSTTAPAPGPAPGPAPAATVAGVWVTGAARLGKTLTATVTTIPFGAPATVQWLRDGTPIPNADGPTYTVQAADMCRRLTAEATSGASSRQSLSLVPVFADVTGSDSFYVEICWMAQNGVTTGFGGETFGPGLSLSRGAMAAFLYRLANDYHPITFTPPKVSPFVDVSTHNEFYKNITWLYSTGVTTGWSVGGGKKAFGPDQPVTRDAMAAFIYRLSDYYNPITFTAPRTSPFVDVSPVSQFYKNITWLASKGITTGWPVGGGKKAFGPGLPVTRGQVAAFLYRLAAVQGI